MENIENLLKENKIQIVKCSDSNEVWILPIEKNLDNTIFDISVWPENTIDLINYIFDLEKVWELLKDFNII